MKLIFPVFLIFIKILSVQGQSADSTLHGQTAQKSFQFGVSITPQISKLWNGGNSGEGKAGFGYSIGTELDTRLSERIKLETGIHLQRAELIERYHHLQWPADVINGQWDKTRSYEQFEADYFSIGLDAGVIFGLGSKENGWLLNTSVLLRRMLKVDDQFVINESGYLHEPIKEEFMNIYNKTQLFLCIGAQYNLGLGAHNHIRVGPEIEYSIRDLINSSDENSLWLYDGGHPVFLGLKAGIFIF
ncbi:MAG: hypothetical protein ABI761_19245 [Saprospiraceae bacterium]